MGLARACWQSKQIPGSLGWTSLDSCSRRKAGSCQDDRPTLHTRPFVHQQEGRSSCLESRFRTITFLGLERQLRAEASPSLWPHLRALCLLSHSDPEFCSWGKPGHQLPCPELQALGNFHLKPPSGEQVTARPQREKGPGTHRRGQRPAHFTRPENILGQPRGRTYICSYSCLHAGLGWSLAPPKKAGGCWARPLTHRLKALTLPCCGNLITTRSHSCRVLCSISSPSWEPHMALRVGVEDFHHIRQETGSQEFSRLSEIPIRGMEFELRPHDSSHRALSAKPCCVPALDLSLLGYCEHVELDLQIPGCYELCRLS